MVDFYDPYRMHQQQQMSQTGQPSMPQQGMPQQGMPQQGMPMQQPVQPASVPTYHMPNESEVQAAYKQHKEDTAGWGGGLRPNFVKFLGPQGQQRWDESIPKGFKSQVLLRILPTWAEGKNFFQRKRSHFVKTHSFPRGKSVGCSGPETCLICKGKEGALNTNDPELQKRARDFGRVNNEFLYNVALLEFPQAHMMEDGVMRPYILGARPTLHDSIGDLVEGRQGAFNIIDLMQGRPIQITREKTGYGRMDIRYSVLDYEVAPLPAQFYPLMDNLWNLEEMDATVPQELIAQIVGELGFPMPGAPSVHMMPTPPMPNPYAQQPAMGSPQYPSVESAPPTVAPLTVGAMPAPQTTGGAQQFNPPPVASTGTGTSMPYSPQPSQAGQMPNTQQNQGVSAARADGRDRCFGNYAPGDNQCLTCPPDLQPSCMAQSQQAAAQQASQGQQTAPPMNMPNLSNPAATGPVRTPEPPPVSSTVPGQTLEQLQNKLVGR